MRPWKTWLGLGLLAASVALTACSAPQAAPTATGVPASPTAAQATATDIVVPSPTPQSTATQFVETDYCIACHTDKDQLILTAKLEEEVPQESEGAG